MSKQAMPMQKVKSSSISHIGYDESAHTMAVKFASGDTYHYHEVEKSVFDKMLKAESPGKHLQANIVGKYKHKRL